MNLIRTWLHQAIGRHRAVYKISHVCFRIFEFSMILLTICKVLTFLRENMLCIKLKVPPSCQIYIYIPTKHGLELLCFFVFFVLVLWASSVPVRLTCGIGLTGSITEQRTMLGINVKYIALVYTRTQNLKGSSITSSTHSVYIFQNMFHTMWQLRCLLNIILKWILSVILWWIPKSNTYQKVLST